VREFHLWYCCSAAAPQIVEGVLCSGIRQRSTLFYTSFCFPPPFRSVSSLSRDAVALHECGVSAGPLSLEAATTNKSGNKIEKNRNAKLPLQNGPRETQTTHVSSNRARALGMCSGHPPFFFAAHLPHTNPSVDHLCFSAFSRCYWTRLTCCFVLLNRKCDLWERYSEVPFTEEKSLDK
jgi:hypothetical protein